MLGVSKAFPGVRALDRVDFRVDAGEVHALMGENGAGKSTLIKIMTGALGRDDGEIRIDGNAGRDQLAGRGARAGRRHGLSGGQSDPDDVGDQESDPRPPAAPVRADFLAHGAEPAPASGSSGSTIDIDVERPLGSYSVAVQQLVAIARALEDDTRVLVLDEPTASLDADEVELLFQILRDLKSRGIAIVFITHFLDQVYKIADRISVLRNGRLVGEGATAELPRLKLISLMLGRELERNRTAARNGPPGREGRAASRRRGTRGAAA